MTEAEALELLEAATSNSFTGFSLDRSVMFAYVVTAYVWCGKLTGRHAMLASGLFAFGAVSGIGAICISLTRASGIFA